MATLGPAPLPAEGLLFQAVALPQTFGPAQDTPIGLLFQVGATAGATPPVYYRRTLSSFGTRVGDRQTIKGSE